MARTTINGGAQKRSATQERRRGRKRPQRNAKTLRVNPEVLLGVDPELLRGLDNVKVVVIQPAPIWARWTEGLMIHVAGSGIVAAIGFGAGAMFGWFIA